MVHPPPARPKPEVLYALPDYESQEEVMIASLRRSSICLPFPETVPDVFRNRKLPDFNQCGRSPVDF